MKLRAGALVTEPVSGFDHLPLVPGVAENLSSPLLRNHLLLRSWEGASPSSIPSPHGRVHFSKTCADSAQGLAFVRALVHAAVREYQESDAPSQQESSAPDSQTKGV